MESSIDVLLPSLFKLAVATVCGGVIGLEREIHGRPAGLRTNALVCLASCLLIIVSRTGALAGLDRSLDFVLNVDPSRMAAGIVTGIGFLGAGAIIRVKDSFIRGLTTAAGIWFVAAVGIAIGLDAFALAGASTAIGLMVLGLLSRIERNIEDVSYRSLVVDADSAMLQEIEAALTELLAAREISVQQTSYDMDIEKKRCEITLSIRTKSRDKTSSIVRNIASIHGVSRVVWS